MVSQLWKFSRILKNRSKNGADFTRKFTWNEGSPLNRRVSRSMKAWPTSVFTAPHLYIRLSVIRSPSRNGYSPLVGMHPLPCPLTVTDINKLSMRSFQRIFRIRFGRRNHSWKVRRRQARWPRWPPAPAGRTCPGSGPVPQTSPDWPCTSFQCHRPRRYGVWQ